MRNKMSYDGVGGKATLPNGKVLKVQGGNGLQESYSPHELDTMYLSEVSGEPQVHQFARSRDLAIDITMTNFVRAYKFETLTFIGDTVAPRRAVKSKSGRYKTRGKEALDIHVSDQLSDRGMANEIVWAAGETPYFIDPHGLVGFCSDEEIEENGALQCATEVSILLKAAVALRQEIRVRNAADATSNTSTPATNWDTSATIHSDVKDAKQAMKSLSGFLPNVFAIGDHIADAVVANTNIKSDIVSAMSVADGREVLSAMSGQDLARFRPWGMQVVMPDCMYNSANAGLARVLARVWGDDGYMFRIDNEMRSMTWALQFEMLKEMIVRWRSENPGGWYYTIIYKRVVKEVTPESIHKLIDLL